MTTSADTYVLRPALKYIVLRMVGLGIAIGAIFGFIFINANKYNLDHTNVSIMWKICIISIGAIAACMVIWRNNTKLILKDAELIEKKGVFSSYTNRMPIRSMTNFRIEQSFIGKLGGLANIFIDSAGGAGFTDEIRLSNVDKEELSEFLEQVNKIVSSLRDQEKTVPEA